MESYIISINGEEIADFSNIEIWRNCVDSMKETRKANGVSYTNIATGNKIDFLYGNANDTAIIMKYWLMERAEKRRARIARRIYGKHIPAHKRYKSGNWYPTRRDGIKEVFIESLKAAIFGAILGGFLAYLAI